ncbi:hypothetical protein D9M71_469910 [compost metagenome]
MFGQGPAHTLLAQLRGGSGLEAGKRQQLDRSLQAVAQVQGNQFLEHLVAGLFIVTHQRAKHWRVLVRVSANQLGLVLGQTVIDQKQLDPAPP